MQAPRVFSAVIAGCDQSLSPTRIALDSLSSVLSLHLICVGHERASRLHAATGQPRVESTLGDRYTIRLSARKPIGVLRYATLHFRASAVNQSVCVWVRVTVLHDHHWTRRTWPTPGGHQGVTGTFAGSRASPWSLNSRIMNLCNAFGIFLSSSAHGLDTKVHRSVYFGDLRRRRTPAVAVSLRFPLPGARVAADKR
jgi:hypothetical protein